ncbi:MAG: siphovirus Gp157 family protein, partial [Rubrivivax sp.]|nr:siphovirus Gp157 family protein [Rubrivivax sp.]
MSEPLYEIVARYQADLAKLQDMDLPPEVVLDTIEAMQGAVEEKVRAVVAFALDLERAAEAREAEAKRMSEGAQRLADRAESIKMYAQIALMNSGLKLPLIAPEFTLNLAKLPPSVEITSPDSVPSAYRQTTITFTIKGEPKGPAWMAAQHTFQQAGFAMTEDVKPMKKVIGDALKAGAEVP